MNWKEIFERIASDPRYQANLSWGESRPGHPEGTISAHIQELENNLSAVRDQLTDEQYWKIRILLHTHDTFKANARRGSAINDPDSHASLARQFLAEFCDSSDLLNMVQYHDEGFALWRQYESKGKCNQTRLKSLIDAIRDWDLFLIFNILDGCTEGKSREPLKWLIQELKPYVRSWVTADFMRAIPEAPRAVEERST